MLAALMSGGVRQNRNSISEKPLPIAPSNRASSQSPVRGEQALNATPAHRARPSIAGALSFQRPKRKIVWKGKTCTIALPLENVKDETGQSKLPLKPEEVAERSASFLRDGLSVRGFDLSEFHLGDVLTGQSCEVYPDAKDFQDALTNRRYTVRIPDKQLWDDYVKQIQEEKLRALGVSLGGEDPPPRAPSAMSQMSRQASSQSPFPQAFTGSLSASGLRSPMEQVLPPPGSSPILQFPFPQGVISPSVQPAIPRASGLHLASQSVAFNRDRVFSPNSLSSHPPSTPGQQYLGSLPSSRGLSPLIDERKQSVWSPQSISPLPEMLQNGFGQGQFNLQPYLQRQGRFASISHPTTPISLQQQVSNSLHEQMPAQYVSQPEIASPLPQGRSHRHNVSASLQKEIDEAENSLETSIAQQLEDANGARHPFATSESLASPAKDSAVEPISQQLPSKSMSIVSDIETNPSQSNSPKPSSAKLAPASNHARKTSVSRLNVNAQEFVFNPTKSSFAPVFAFGEKSPMAPLSATSASFDGKHSNDTSNTSAFSPGLNVTAAPFVPGQPVAPSANRVFSFSSTVPTLKANAPEFTPGSVFGEIPGGVMDKRPNAGRVFSYGDMIQLPKKSKAVPIVTPTDEDETREDEEGRITQAEGRQKRVRREGGSGSQIHLFATPQHERAVSDASVIAIANLAQDSAESPEIEAEQAKIRSQADTANAAIISNVGEQDHEATAETSASVNSKEYGDLGATQSDSVGTSKVVSDGNVEAPDQLEEPVRDTKQNISETPDYTIGIDPVTNPSVVLKETAENSPTPAIRDNTSIEKSTELVAPGPLQHLLSAPLHGTDTALNTADFLDAPSNLASPFPRDTEQSSGLNVEGSQLHGATRLHDVSQAINALDDPFTVGDHEDGNHTDKSTTDLRTASPEMEEKKVTTGLVGAKEKEIADHTPRESASVLEKKIPALSAKAKPFVFNPTVSVFKPESISPASIGVSKIGRPDVPEFKPSAVQPILKSQANLPSPEQAPPHPTIDLVTMLKQDPPRKPAFSGGLGASRYASEEPAVIAEKIPPRAKSLSPKPAVIRPSTDTTQPSSQPKIVNSPETPLRRRVSSPELSPFASDDRKSASDRQYSRPVTPTKIPLAERIANGVHYVEPSFKEIDDVMKQLNGDDSDLGVERDPGQVWRSPKRNARDEVAAPVRTATPLSERLKASPSRLPTSSPNNLDRPFQYLPDQDYGSSNSEDSRRRDAAAEYAARNARYSPSYKRPHHSDKVDDGSPLHRLNHKSSDSISNWDDIVSDDEVADFHGRVGFFGNRVKHVIGNAIDDRLQPVESTLAKLSTMLSKLDTRSRSSRPRRSRSVESDADDEDDEAEVARAVSPLLKDRRFEKLKSILTEVISHHQGPNDGMKQILDSVADLKSELGKHDKSVTDEPNNGAIDRLAASVAEIKSVLASQPSPPSSDGSTKVLEAISEFKALLADQNSKSAANEDSSSSYERLVDLTKVVTGLQRSLAEQQQSQSQNIKSIVEDAVEKHVRGKSAAVQSSQERAMSEKLQLQIAGLESMLRAADERTAEESTLRREAEDQLAENERELKAAIAEATQQREAAEETEASLRSILNDHQQSKQHCAALEEVQITLEHKLADERDKSIALEETIAEYRISHDDWRKDIDAANAENDELSRTVESLREELEDGILSRQALKIKFEKIQEEMISATQSIARDQAAWRHKDEEHKAKHELSGARLEAEARTRERLELEIDRLEKQEREAMKARTLVEDIRSQNGNLTNMVNELRSKAHHFQERSMSFERELHDAKERSRLEMQRLVGVSKNDVDSAKQQTQIVRADLEGVIQRLEDQVVHLQADAKSTKERYQAMLEEASISKDTALREAAEAREAALQEHYRFHERTMHDLQVSHERVTGELKKDHTRTVTNAHEDHQRSIHNLMEDHKMALGVAIQEKNLAEQELDGRLALSEDKNSHLQEKVKHLEERLAIANEAAQAAVEAAKSARKSTSASPAGRALPPSLRGFDPQALRQTVETLQDQLGERERQIETLRNELEEIDKDAPQKVKDRDAEINWLRELLGVRMDDMQDIIVQLSTPHFDRIAVRDAVIRLRANIQMEEQERERQLAGGTKFPSLADIRASPKALPLAAAAAWGNWSRRGQSSLSSLAEMAVPSVSSSADQTPSKSSPQSFLSGLLTPPSTNMRHTPRGRASLSRPTSAQQRPSASFSTPKRQIVLDHNARNQIDRASEVPETPALLTKSSYDADAPEGPHHYSLDQYTSEEVDLPSEDTSQQGDNDSSTIITNENDNPTSNPFGPSIELAG